MLIELDRNPPARVLRLFGGVWLPLFLAIAGGLVWRGGGNPATSWVLWGVAALSIVVALARPAWLRWLYVGLMVVTWPIGWVLSLVVLALIYYGVITTAGLALRVFGKDPLRKRGSPAVASYWRSRRAPADVERYFRQ
ncbi:MAG TPA: SxtJ family membrane protein, partial [Thermoanaerobaculia bacterium]|nr:SxtJ family membrane protein [Thermoanaerobaculia bacterium]